MGEAISKLAEINQIVRRVGDVLLRYYGPKYPRYSVEGHRSQFVSLFRVVAEVPIEILAELVVDKDQLVDYITAKSACPFKKLLHLLGRKVSVLVRTGL
jgi:hypothetical protein